MTIGALSWSLPKLHSATRQRMHKLHTRVRVTPSDPAIYAEPVGGAWNAEGVWLAAALYRGRAFCSAATRYLSTLQHPDPTEVTWPVPQPTRQDWPVRLDKEGNGHELFEPLARTGPGRNRACLR